MMDILKLLKSSVSSQFQLVYAYDDDWHDAFTFVYIPKDYATDGLGDGATELKLIHNKLYSKLKRLGYEITGKKISSSAGYIDYTYANLALSLEHIRFPSIRIAASSVPSSSAEGQSIVTIVIDAWDEA